jgi:hypothetical protein
VIQAGNATFGWRFFVYDCHQAEIGQKQPAIKLPKSRRIMPLALFRHLQDLAECLVPDAG